MDDSSAMPDPDRRLGDAYAVADGYRGIWFTLDQLDGQYGDKHVGGLGTYTTRHVPMAVYDDRVDEPSSRTAPRAPTLATFRLPWGVTTTRITS